MNRIKKEVIRAIRQFNMISPGDRVTAALSGGADSVALLILLCELRDELDFELSAAHLNHGIRGAEAARDAEFSETLCKKLSVPFTGGAVDVPAVCAETGESTETAARRIRYDFLQNCAREGKIATAHNLTDNAETVLFNLARGTGIKGMCGIPPVRDNIIRPLIFVGGEDIRAFLAKIGQEYVVDSTNLCDDYSRNRIRHKIMPELCEINSRASENIMRLCRKLGEDDDFLRIEAEKLYLSADRGDWLDSAVLNEAHPAILSRALRIFAGNAGLNPDDLHTRELISLLESGSGRRELGLGYTAELLKGRLYISGGMPPGADEEEVQISFKLADRYKINNLLLKNAIDYDKISDNIIIRRRQNGDKFEAAGRGVVKSLKKLFNEAAIPMRDRDSIRILADADGILWIEGFGTAQRCAVNDQTETVLIIQC